MILKRLLSYALILSFGCLARPIHAEESAEPSTRREADVIRTFYLENANVRDVMTMVRSLVGVKHVAADEELYAIVLRDTAKNVELAAKLIRDHDLPRHELVVDVRLIEIDVEELHRLVGRGKAEGAPARLAPEVLARLESSAAARLLIHPKLSLVAGRSAELVAGDRVPIPIGGDGTVSYQEVGFKLVLKSRVHPGTAEVTLDFEMEISHAASEKAGRPVFEAKRIASSARLGDGETYFLAGLSPGGAGALAAGAAVEPKEMVLALTPHVSRRAGVPGRPD